MQALDKAAVDIVKEAVAAVERPPQDFNRPYNLERGLAGAAALGTLGGLSGAGIGIAVFGTAISGAWVLAPVLGLVGLAVGAVGDDAT